MKNYKIAVAGTGYVGLSIATLLSQHHQVIAVDIIPEKVELINNRKSPIQDDYIEKYLAEKDLNLTATLDAKTAWWFVSLYVLLEVYARVLEKTKVLNNLKRLALLSGVLMIAGYGMKVLIPTAEKINTLEWIPYTFLIKQPIFISGYICKKLDVFNRPAVAKFGMFGFIAWAFMFSNIPQSFFLPIVVPCFIAAFCCVPITGIMKRGLLLLGKNSTYMWLTHSWLIYKFLQPVIFSMHDVVANLIVLVIIDLPLAFCFKLLEGKVSKLLSDKCGCVTQ